MALTEDDLLNFLQELVPTQDNIAPDTLLFSDGLLDSVAMMNLIGFVETRCGFQVAMHEVTLENFDSPELILKFVSDHG